MIYDVITYNGEKELFEIRYNILRDYVDQFIVIEFDKTFSGKPKDILFNNTYDKVSHYFHSEDLYNKYSELADSSPNVAKYGPEHWKREFCQKESIKDALALLDPNDKDIVFIGDCDEIWKPECSNINIFVNGYVVKLGCDVYTYYLNNRSSEEFWGPIVTSYETIKDNCINELRSINHRKSDTELCWHFTSMAHDLRKKLTDSYTEDSYANDWVLSNLESNIDNNRDFLGRDFTYKVDESNWPQYLKDNKEKYLHLCKGGI